MSNLDVQLVPARSDNYVYLIFDHSTSTSGVIDPADYAPVKSALDAAGRGLDWIINTHHHDDHTGGNDQLKAEFGAQIAAPAADRHRIRNVDLWLNDGDHFAFGDFDGVVLSTPGHTSGHISLWFEQAGVLFSGDTLFALGCGRLFEGTAEQMWQSLRRYADLPDRTKIYCGHEYTASNAKFALSVDPDNMQLSQRVKQIAELRRRGVATIPTDMGLERATNPFLRPHDASIRKTLGMADQSDSEVFAEIRRRKDHF